jgi:hypothetical protein
VFDPFKGLEVQTGLSLNTLCRWQETQVVDCYAQARIQNLNGP